MKSKKIRKRTEINAKYKEYLNSEEWKEKRKEFIELANKECEECGSTKNLQVHHLNYDNIYHESEEDVEVLCDDCHEDKELEKGTDLDNDYYYYPHVRNG